MENRPVGRVKKVVSGGGGIHRTGEGLGKEISERNVKKEVAEEVLKEAAKTQDAIKNIIRKI